MPRKKIPPKPLEIIHCEGFDIEIMEDGWNINGHGSNKVKEFRSHVDKMVLRMIDDFVDRNHNIKPLMTNKNDYLENPSIFARKADEYGLGAHLEDDQQLRKEYYPVVKIEIEKNIRIKASAAPPPKSFPLQKLLDYFKSSK
jgi:hypothetical protein